MMFSPLLCHTADVQACFQETRDGRRTDTWTIVATIPCRFTCPTPSAAEPADSALIDTVDARVYTGPELQTILSSYHLPLRFSTENAGWTGLYELRVLPEMYAGFSSTVHHGECRVTKVVDT